MGQIIVLTMDTTSQQEQLSALGERFEVEVVEPRWPQCQTTLASSSPGLVVVDGSHAPSHGRAAAKWMASYGRFRTVPFLFLDVSDKDVLKVKKEVPRAQFATWASVVGVSGRMLRR